MPSAGEGICYRKLNLTGRYIPDKDVSFLSIALIKTMTKDNLGEESVYVYLEVVVHHEGKPGQDPKAGAWRLKPKQKS